MKIWEPKPPGTLWATLGLLRDCSTFTFTLVTVMLLYQEMPQNELLNCTVACLASVKNLISCQGNFTAKFFL